MRSGLRGRERPTAMGQGDFEPEGRALAFTAGRAHGAAHELDELLRNREAKAGAAELPADRAVHLIKTLEEPRQLLRGDADPRVGHGEAHAPAAGTNLQPNSPLRRELYRVVEKVEQDLPQPVRVAHDDAGQI